MVSQSDADMPGEPGGDSLPTEPGEPLTGQPCELLVSPEAAGQRLDVFLAGQFSEYSRARLRKAMGAGGVTVAGRRTKVAYKLVAGQRVCVAVPERPAEGPEPEDTPLDILYEDEHLAAVNKPAGMVVHPSKGHWSGTLAAALAFRFEKLSGAGGLTRPGIVHRLDRETSGVILVAKTDAAHHALGQQFQDRTVEKEYFALVSEVPDRDRDVIEQPIGAHPYQREKMAIRAGHATSRPAETYYEVAERFTGFSALRVFPKTGRTHQIRVHLAHVGHAILCDRLYSGRAEITAAHLGDSTSEAADEAQRVLLSRCALHARRIRLRHPATGAALEIEAPLAADIARVWELLRSVCGGG